MKLWDLLRGVTKTQDASAIEFQAFDERLRQQEEQARQQRAETDRLIRLIEQQNIRRRVPGAE